MSKRDLPVMIYKTSTGETICKACITIPLHPDEKVIAECQLLFMRTCNPCSARKYKFDNTTCRIIMSIDGTCRLKEVDSICSYRSYNCHSCSIKENAIKKYKLINSLK